MFGKHIAGSKLAENWGHPLCKLGPEEIGSNHVGTYGVAVTDCWHSRLQGAGGRIGLSVLFQEILFQLIFVYVIKWSAGGAQAALNLVLVAFVTVLTGTPMAWGKTSGGGALEGVGLWLDYSILSIGISASRGEGGKEDSIRASQGRSRQGQASGGDHCEIEICISGHHFLEAVLGTLLQLDRCGAKRCLLADPSRPVNTSEVH